MSRFVLLFLQLCISTAFPWQSGGPSDAVSATVLRGSQAASNEASASSKAELKPGLYAVGCQKCFYHGAQCGCQPAMDYLACLTAHCYPSNQTEFATMCSALQSHCQSELAIDCRGAETVCQGKYNQLSSGGLGLSWDPAAAFENAFCGPFGQCIGEINMHVNIHNSMPMVMPKTTPKAPPEDKTAYLPCEEGVVDFKATSAQTGFLPKTDLREWHEQSRLWLECGLPIHATAKIDNREDWVICTSEVRGNTASCNVGLKRLAAQEAIEGYCVLTDKSGERLTQPLWRNVRNTHEKLPSSNLGEKLDRQEKILSVDEAVDDGIKVKVNVDVRDAKRGANKAVDASGKTINDISEAAADIDDKPPYMRGSDAERRHPPEEDLRRIGDEFGDMQRQGGQAVAAGGQAARRQQAQIRDKAEQARKSARDPIVREVRDLNKASQKKSEELGSKVSEVKDEAAEDVSRARRETARRANTVAEAGGNAADRMQQARKTKPPYMKDSEAKRQAPVPGFDDADYVKDDSPVQSPIVRQFA